MAVAGKKAKKKKKNALGAAPPPPPPVPPVPHLEPVLLGDEEEFESSLVIDTGMGMVKASGPSQQWYCRSLCNHIGSYNL